MKYGLNVADESITIGIKLSQVIEKNEKKIEELEKIIKKLISEKKK